VRWCARCRDPQVRLDHGMDAPLELPEWLGSALGPATTADPGAGRDVSKRVFDFDPARQAAPGAPAFAGVRVYPEALSAAEVDRLIGEIEALPFLPSQSGKQKQHFGPRLNFTRRRMNADRFEGLPAWAHPLEARLRDCVARDDRGDPADRSACLAALAAYTTTDVFVLRYFEAERSNLDFHVDDLHAYGEAILDVSLDADSVLTFLGPANDPTGDLVCIRVPLPARSIAVVYGAARFAWQHAILAGDVRGTRTSITLRTLGPDLRASDAGQRVLERARQAL
jgi:alkylated DNA repair protein alkB family protein 4